MKISLGESKTHSQFSAQGGEACVVHIRPVASLTLLSSVLLSPSTSPCPCLQAFGTQKHKHMDIQRDAKTETQMHTEAGRQEAEALSVHTQANAAMDNPFVYELQLPASVYR